MFEARLFHDVMEPDYEFISCVFGSQDIGYPVPRTRYMVAAVLLGFWLKAAEEGERGDVCEENYPECDDQKIESKLRLQVVVDNQK